MISQNHFNHSLARLWLFCTSADADVGKQPRKLRFVRKSYFFLLCRIRHMLWKHLWIDVSSSCGGVVSWNQSVACCGREVLKELFDWFVQSRVPACCFPKLWWARSSVKREVARTERCHQCVWYSCQGLSLDWVVSRVQMCNSLLYIVKGQLPEVMNRLPTTWNRACKHFFNAVTRTMLRMTAWWTLTGWGGRAGWWRGRDDVEKVENRQGRDEEEETAKRRKVVEKEESLCQYDSCWEIHATELSVDTQKFVRLRCTLWTKLLHHDNMSSLWTELWGLRSYIFSRQFRVHPIDVQGRSKLAHGLCWSTSSRIGETLEASRNVEAHGTHDPKGFIQVQILFLLLEWFEFSSSSFFFIWIEVEWREYSTKVFVCFSFLSLCLTQTHTNTTDTSRRDPALFRSAPQWRTTTRSCSEIRGWNGKIRTRGTKSSCVSQCLRESVSSKPHES